MKLIRKHVLAVAGTMSLLALAAPAAGASAFPWQSTFRSTAVAFPWPGSFGNTANIGGQAGPLGCGSNAPAGNGAAGGTTNQSCGSVLSFIGPSIGQIASVVGPTIIGSPLATVIVSAGPVTVLP